MFEEAWSRYRSSVQWGGETSASVERLPRTRVSTPLAATLIRWWHYGDIGHSRTW